MVAHRIGAKQLRPAASPLVLVGVLAACSSPEASTWGPASSGGAQSGSSSGAAAGSSSGGSSSSGTTTTDAATGAAPEASVPEAGEVPEAAGDDASYDGYSGPFGDDASCGASSANYGGVGQMPQIPIQYTSPPVPPIIPPDCPGDPTQGFTEYMDTFVIQRPYDLAACDRFSYENGIYTFWVLPTDKPHVMGNTTAPRTEARYSDMSTGTRIWSADVMFESPLNDTCVMQIHNEVGSIAAYYRVIGGRMFNLGTGQTVLTNYYNQWFNLKVVFDMDTHQVSAYVNNCLKETHTAPTGPTPNWYFKNGTYTCQAAICRDHFKNLHLYQK